MQILYFNFQKNIIVINVVNNLCNPSPKDEGDIILFTPLRWKFHIPYKYVCS